MTTAAKELGDQPAFPCSLAVLSNGASKRELFAAMMAQGLLSNPETSKFIASAGLAASAKRFEAISETAQMQADALLEQLAKQS